jgi:tellurite resistance protein
MAPFACALVSIALESQSKARLKRLLTLIKKQRRLEKIMS